MEYSNVPATGVIMPPQRYAEPAGLPYLRFEGTSMMQHQPVYYTQPHEQVIQQRQIATYPQQQGMQMVGFDPRVTTTYAEPMSGVRMPQEQVYAPQRQPILMDATSQRYQVHDQFISVARPEGRQMNVS